MSGEESTPEEPRRPLLRVVRGNPDDVELAALTAVVAAATASGGEQAAGPAPSAWADRSALARGPLRHGAGAWRASAQPR